MARGGTVVIDAAGGSSDFASAAEKEIGLLFPDGKLDVLPPDAPLYQTGAKPLGAVTYRAFAKRVIGSEKGPRLEVLEVDGRPAVIFSREDLSVGLVGEPVDGVVGYSPASATDLMARIVLFAGGLNK